MTGIFYVLLRQHGGGTDIEIGVSTESWPSFSFLASILPGLESETFGSWIRRYTNELYRILRPQYYRYISKKCFLHIAAKPIFSDRQQMCIVAVCLREMVLFCARTHIHTHTHTHTVNTATSTWQTVTCQTSWPPGIPITQREMGEGAERETQRERGGGGVIRMDIHASLSLVVCQTTDRPDSPVNALIVFCYVPRLLSPLRVVCLLPKMKLFNAEQPPLVQTSNKKETDEAHTKKPGGIKTSPTGFRYRP